jgi:hypothetical protein
MGEAKLGYPGDGINVLIGAFHRKHERIGSFGCATKKHGRLPS